MLYNTRHGAPFFVKRPLFLHDFRLFKLQNKVSPTVRLILIQNFRFRWNSGIPLSRSTTKRSLWKSCRYLGVRGYFVYSFGWLSAFLGRGPAPPVRADQSRCLWFSLSWVGYSHSRRQKSNKPGKNSIRSKICFLFLKRLWLSDRHS